MIAETLDALEEALLDSGDAGSAYCHLQEEDGPAVAVCGSGVAHHLGVHAPWDGRSHCPVCGRPACPRCVHIFDVFNRTGGWEGV